MNDDKKFFAAFGLFAVVAVLFNLALIAAVITGIVIAIQHFG